MVAALDGQDGCPRPLEGFQDLGMLVSYIPLAHYESGISRTLLDFSSNCTLVERASAYSSPSKTLSAGSKLV